MSRAAALRVLVSVAIDLAGWILVLPAARLLRMHGMADAWIRHRSRTSGEEAFWLTCRGDYYSAIGQRGEAEASYRSAIAVDQSDGFPHAVFGAYLAKEGRLAEALDHYGTALELGTGSGEDYERAMRDRMLELKAQVAMART